MNELEKRLFEFFIFFVVGIFFIYDQFISIVAPRAYVPGGIVTAGRYRVDAL